LINAGSRVVVTGGAGFIGSHLVDALHRTGNDVRVVDLVERPARLAADIEYVRADITSLAAATTNTRGAHVVFHLAGNPNTTKSVLDPLGDLDCNARGTLAVLEACRLNKVAKLVYVSTASVYGRPQTVPIRESHRLLPVLPYGVSKLTGERYCAAYSAMYGMSIVVARPFCVYGPRENPAHALVEVSRYMRWHLAGYAIPVIGDAAVKSRDFIHVQDAIDALILLANRGKSGETYNVGSGTETTMRKLVDEIAACCGGGALLTEDVDADYDTYRLVADIGKLSELGFAPRVNLRSGLLDLARALGSSPALPTNPTILRSGEHGELVSTPVPGR
jgi:UDP-glucose 4-epimerase